MTTQDQIRGELLAAIAQARVAATRIEAALKLMGEQLPDEEPQVHNED